MLAVALSPVKRRSQDQGLRSPALAQEGIEIGVVTRPHGVRGELKVRLHNPASDALADPTSLWLESPTGERIAPVARGRPDAAGAVIGVALAADRDAAEALRGARLMRDRSAIALEEDEYLCADLVGCRVRDGDRDLGRVVDVLSAGAADVLVIRDGATERMIPLVDDWVVAIDTQARAIEVTGSAQFDDEPE